MPTYTVTGLHNTATKAVLISAVLEGTPRQLSARTGSGEWGQWTRFAEQIEAANPGRAESAIVRRFAKA